MPPDAHRPAGRVSEATEEQQQRRLARPAGPHYCNEFARTDVQSSGSQGDDLDWALLVDLAGIVKLQHHLTRCHRGTNRRGSHDAPRTRHP